MDIRTFFSDLSKPESETQKQIQTEKETTYTLPPPSEEQQEILKAVTDGKNVMVDAVAGSGKTTSILLLASSLPTKRFSLFTYNARLKTETRQRVLALGLTNIQVHSYHSFGLRHYTSPCMNDIHLMNIVKYNTPLLHNPNPDIVILDEAQDMTPPYYSFVRKCLTDMTNNKCQLVVLGDHMQCIYDFPQKGADFRFLTFAEKVWENGRPWEKLHLRVSYRITKHMETFVNDIVLGYPRMKAVKEHDAPVTYITGDLFRKVPKRIVQEVTSLLDQGYSPGDIFILAPSVRSYNESNPIKTLENSLVKRGIPCYAPLSDDEELKEEILHGKICFSSFHQCKGLERKVVFVYSFNHSYYSIYARDKDPSFCSNTLYVAITRAMQRLYVCGENKNDAPLKCLHREKLRECTDAIRMIHLDGEIFTSSKWNYEKVSKDVIPLRRVTDLIRFLPEQLTEQILQLANVVQIQKPYCKIKIADVIETTGGRKEGVSELNGIAIPAVYEYRWSDDCAIQSDLQYFYMNKLSSLPFDSPLRKWRDIVLNQPETSSDFLKLANVYSAYTSGYMHKLEQIHDYSWMKEQTMEDLLDVLVKTIGDQSEEAMFEYTLDLENYHDVQIQGRCDLLNEKELWEFKCVKELVPEHTVQLALYAWLYMKTEYQEKEKGHRKFLLHNICTGEVLQLKGIENLDMIADMVLDNHFRTAKEKTDEMFLEECKKNAVSVPCLGKAEVPRSSERGSTMCFLVED